MPIEELDLLDLEIQHAQLANICKQYVLDLHGWVRMHGFHEYPVRRIAEVTGQLKALGIK